MKKPWGQAVSGLALCILLIPGITLLRGQTEEPRLLDFTVVAVDGHGHPVTGLTAEDFQVTDEGKRQQIAYFHPYEGKPIETRAQGEFSNRRGSGSQHVTLILFDLLNEHFGTRAVTSNQIIQGLQKVENSDSLFLYLLTLDGRLFAVHGLTGPGPDTPEPGEAPWTKNIKPLLSGALTTVTRPRTPQEDIPAYRVDLTLKALNAVALQLSAFPGRKSVVLVSDGVPLVVRGQGNDFFDTTPMLRQLSETFDRAQTAIYPVTPNMLGSRDAIGGLESFAMLDQIAGLTGGRPTGSKDVLAAVTQALNDSASTYRIGYYASPKTFDSKFHKLKITSSRKDVHVQARNGYYAYPTEPNARADSAIDEAIASAADSAEIGVAGTLTVDPQNRDHAHLAVRIDANDVALPQDANGYTGQLRLAIAGYQPDGNAVHSPIIPFDLHYTAVQRDQALNGGIPVTQDVAVGKGMTRVRFIVFDRGSNAIGSLTIPLQQPARTN